MRSRLVGACRSTHVGALLAFVALVAPGVGVPAVWNPAIAAQQTTAGTADERTMLIGGVRRMYLVHDFSASAPAPVVILLHGGGGNARNAVHMTGFDRIAEREHLIAVYPDGTANRPRVPLHTWNAGHCCASAMENRVDDVGFIGAIIDALVTSGRADATRVYVTGMSNGGMMTHRIGRELSAKVAAIAPVVGAVFGDEAPPHAPVPAFIIVGADDEIVPGAGGPLQLRALLGIGGRAADRDVSPAIDQARYWAQANGCGEPTRVVGTASTVTTWRNCRSNAPVVYHVVAGNGHAWPGGEPGRAGAAQPSRAFDASAEMWAFLKTQQRLPPRR